MRDTEAGSDYGGGHQSSSGKIGVVEPGDATVSRVLVAFREYIKYAKMLSKILEQAFSSNEYAGGKFEGSRRSLGGGGVVGYSPHGPQVVLPRGGEIKAEEDTTHGLPVA